MSGIGIEGLEKLGKNINSLKRALPEDLRYSLGRGLLVIEGEAKTLVPVDMGRLKSSIVTETTVLEEGIVEGAVGTNVEYASHVEFGTGVHAENGKGRKTPWTYKSKTGFVRTSGQTPQPFMRPALDSKKEEAEEEIRTSFAEAHLRRVK